MSKSAGGFGLFRAQRDAELVLERIRPHVVRAEVAGSVRRQRPLVHDVDVVVERDPADPWIMRRIEQSLADVLAGDGASGHLRYRLVKEGPSIVSFVQEAKNAHTQGWVPFGPNLDLYIASPDTWGITLLIRTGSAAHNVRLVERARHMLPARKLAVSRGLVDTADQVIASRTEQEIFEALGMGFVPPEKREAPEYESWIRGEAAV
jgi:DNA polymerase (family 10)